MIMSKNKKVLNSTPKKVKLNAPSKIKTADKNKVADKTGYSVAHVFNVAAGRRYNEQIINLFNGLTARRK